MRPRRVCPESSLLPVEVQGLFLGVSVNLWEGGRNQALAITFSWSPLCEEQSICSKFQDAFQAIVISPSSFFSPSLLFPSFPTCYCDEFWLPLDHGQLMDCVIISNSGCLHLHSTCEFHSLSQLIHSHNTPTPLSPSAHTDVYIL